MLPNMQASPQWWLARAKTMTLRAALLIGIGGLAVLLIIRDWDCSLSDSAGSEVCWLAAG